MPLIATDYHGVELIATDCLHHDLADERPLHAPLSDHCMRRSPTIACAALRPLHAPLPDQAFDGRTSLKVSLNGLHFVGVSAAAAASAGASPAPATYAASTASAATAASTAASAASAASSAASAPSAASGRRLTSLVGDGGGSTSSSSSSSSSSYILSSTALVAEAALPQPANYDGGTVGLSYWYYREPELYADDA